MAIEYKQQPTNPYNWGGILHYSKDVEPTGT